MKVNTDNMIYQRISSFGHVKINEPLKNHTSFKTGGPADFMIWPKDKDSLREIIVLSNENFIPVTVLGGCTNLLVGDKGIRGIVIMMNSAADISKGSLCIKGDGLIYSDSIIRKDDFVRFCIDAGYEGMEFMAGIPGCIGGGIIMNAGTIDGNFSDILDSILYMNGNGQLVKQNISSGTGGYRTMRLPADSIILDSFFKLNKTVNKEEVKSKINEILKERRMKHPLDYPSAGSVFKNPPGYFSWKLIDDSGLKGKRIGGACVSGLHTNFIINIGQASSLDILNLVDCIKERVYSKFNILLETEIRILGEF